MKMLLLRLMPYEFLATARIIHLFCSIRYISLRVSQQSFSRTEWQEYQVYQVYQVYQILLANSKGSIDKVQEDC